MLQLGLPHVNVMTKLDEMKKFSQQLDFNIDFYTEVLDLRYLLEKLDEDPMTAKLVYYHSNIFRTSLNLRCSIERFFFTGTRNSMQH